MQLSTFLRRAFRPDRPKLLAFETARRDPINTSSAVWLTWMLFVLKTGMTDLKDSVCVRPSAVYKTTDSHLSALRRNLENIFRSSERATGAAAPTVH